MESINDFASLLNSSLIPKTDMSYKGTLVSISTAKFSKASFYTNKEFLSL
jgi:hypothetical protein